MSLLPRGHSALIWLPSSSDDYHNDPYLSMTILGIGAWSAEELQTAATFTVDKENITKDNVATRPQR